MLRALVKVSRIVAEISIGLFVDIFRLAENVTLTTLVEKLVGKRFTDSAAAADAAALSTGKELQDTGELAEAVLKSTEKPVADAVATTDTGVVGNQNYASNYFAEDYVGESRSFT